MGRNELINREIRGIRVTNGIILPLLTGETDRDLEEDELEENSLWANLEEKPY